MIPGSQNARFLEIAAKLKPELNRKIETPTAIVRVEKDESSVMGWKAVDAVSGEESQALGEGEQVIFDFSGHRAGYLEFHIESVLTGIEPADAPCRLRITFGEVLNDVAESFDNYKAWISPSWLPDEIINVDYLPETVYMPRRHAFRYVKIEVISTSLRFKVKFSKLKAHAVTSASFEDPPGLTFSKTGSDLGMEDKALLQAIDRASLKTLRNCMQTVYEDGPRRDMRLWIGDLRLQAACSYVTFKDYDLAKRCLYLFAGLPFDDEGLLCACVYEKPEPKFGGNSIVDYAMLFASTLLDYVQASGDTETGKDLYPIAAKQFKFFASNYTSDLRYEIPTRDMADGGSGWHFVDWEPTLDKEAAEHSIMVYCLKAVKDLAALLGLEEPSYSIGSAIQDEPVTSVISKLVAANRKHYFDEEQGVFISGPERQVSWASNAWAVIAGVVEEKHIAQKALQVAYTKKGSVTGMTPYLHHYLCEAFIQADLPDLALKHIKQYWGSMIDAGAETFFEAWDPLNPRVSPYGDLHSNSFCHAWSCTPALLLRQMGYV